MASNVTGIYGGILADFPEQFQSYTYWPASADFNDGWTPTGKPVADRGVFHNDKSGVVNSNGNTVFYAHYKLWSKTDYPDGTFITWRGSNWRVLHDNDWSTQDGYTQYMVNLVVGSDGGKTVDPAYSNGGTNL
jgi:hypothetical protein